MQNKVMISYSSVDRDFATELEGHLRSYGVATLFDDTFADAGDRVTTILEDMVRGASVLVVILTPDSIDSQWVRFELSLFRTRMIVDNSLKIVPLLLRECDVPEELKSLSIADVSSPVTRPQVLSGVITALRADFSGNDTITASRISSRMSNSQRNELESLIDTSINRGMHRLKDELSAIVDMIQKHQHLLTPDAIAKKEQTAAGEVWVLTTHLYNDVEDKDIQRSVRTNFERGVSYVYFVPDTQVIRRRMAQYENLYADYTTQWRFVRLVSGVFMPFDEVVLYDPLETARLWGYAQMKYPISGRQDDDLFLKLPDRNMVDMAKSLERLLDANEDNE